jgi:hypothetical protein
VNENLDRRTDNEWFPFLAAGGMDEVDFWRPLALGHRTVIPFRSISTKPPSFSS